MNKAATALGRFVIGACAVAVSGVLYAYALSILWGWFVVPLGVDNIGVARAYGISLIVCLATFRPGAARNPDHGILDGIRDMSVLSLMFVFLGWLVHLSMAN